MIWNHKQGARGKLTSSLLYLVPTLLVLFCAQKIAFSRHKPASKSERSFRYSRKGAPGRPIPINNRMTATKSGNNITYTIVTDDNGNRGAGRTYIVTALDLNSRQSYKSPDTPDNHYQDAQGWPSKIDYNNAVPSTFSTKTITIMPVGSLPAYVIMKAWAWNKYPLNPPDNPGIQPSHEPLVPPDDCLACSTSGDLNPQHCVAIPVNPSKIRRGKWLKCILNLPDAYGQGDYIVIADRPDALTPIANAKQYQINSSKYKSDWHVKLSIPPGKARNHVKLRVPQDEAWNSVMFKVMKTTGRITLYVIPATRASSAKVTAYTAPVNEVNGAKLHSRSHQRR